MKASVVVVRLRHVAISLLCLGILNGSLLALAQQGFFTREDVMKYTPDWKGERFPDGRPKVPDAILDRMKSVTLEEAWAVLESNGFMHQYDDGWLSIHPKVSIQIGWTPCHLNVGAARHSETAGSAGRCR